MVRATAETKSSPMGLQNPVRSGSAVAIQGLSNSSPPACDDGFTASRGIIRRLDRGDSVMTESPLSSRGYRSPLRD